MHHTHHTTVTTHTHVHAHTHRHTPHTHTHMHHTTQCSQRIHYTHASHECTHAYTHTHTHAVSNSPYIICTCFSTLNMVGMRSERMLPNKGPVTSLGTTGICGCSCHSGVKLKEAWSLHLPRSHWLVNLVIHWVVCLVML